MSETLQEEEFHKKRALMPFIKRIFKHSFKYKKWTYGLIFSCILVAVIDGIMPLIWYKYIDNFITPTIIQYKDAGKVAFTDTVMHTFYMFIVVYLVVIVLQIIGMAIFTYLAGKVKEKVIFDLREQMFAKLQHLPYSFYDQSALGWLSIRLTSDVDKVSEIISFGFISLILGAIMILVSLIAMFFYNWQLALILVAVLPIMLILSIKIRSLILIYARKARRLYSTMAAYLTENFNGIEVNKASVHEEKTYKDFKNITYDLRVASYRSSYYTAMYNPVVVLTGSIVAALVIYYGGYQVVNAQSGFTVGLLAAFFGYARMIFEPILELTRFYSAAQDSLSAGERIYSLIDEPVNIADEPNSVEITKMKGEIEFKNVRFQYVPDKVIFEELNLHIQAGESIALVGPTGEGKSTLTSLIARFYEPTQGEICIDGENYKTKKLHSYRNNLGILLQTSYLFSGTIRENILYGKLNASDNEIIQALETIGATQFIHRLNEEVGEEGNNLSSGEKQLISFARIVLKNPSILIMDEATSSLDTLTEQKIQKGIENLLQNRTSIVVAHRLSTIKNCSRILVIQKGKIIEQGNHHQLIAQKGHYYNLYTQQTLN